MQPFWPQGCLLSRENAALALNHLAHTCCTDLWEVFLHNTNPDPRWWPSVVCPSRGYRSFCAAIPSFSHLKSSEHAASDLSSHANPIHAGEKKHRPPVGCSVTSWHLLKHLDSWIPSLPWEVLCNQSHSSVINAALLRKSTRAAEKWWGGFIDIHWLTYHTLLVHVWKLGSFNLMELECNTEW